MQSFSYNIPWLIIKDYIDTHFHVFYLNIHNVIKYSQFLFIRISKPIDGGGFQANETHWKFDCASHTADEHITLCVAFAFDRVCHLFVGGKQSRKRGIAASNQMENAATIRNLLTCCASAAEVLSSCR